MAARRRKSRKAGAARSGTSGKRSARPRAKATRPKPRKAAAPRARAKKKPAPARARRTPKPRPRAERAAAAPRGAAQPPLVAGAPIEVGVVLHYYARAAAGVVALSRPIHRGDTIHVRGQTTDFVQAVQELALEGAPVSEGMPPQQVGVRLAQRARAGDRVYRVSW
jgi:putative protease